MDRILFLHCQSEWLETCLQGARFLGVPGQGFLLEQDALTFLQSGGVASVVAVDAEVFWQSEATWRQILHLHSPYASLVLIGADDEQERIDASVLDGSATAGLRFGAGGSELRGILQQALVRARERVQAPIPAGTKPAT